MMKKVYFTLLILYGNLSTIADILEFIFMIIILNISRFLLSTSLIENLHLYINLVYLYISETAKFHLRFGLSSRIIYFPRKPTGSKLKLSCYSGNQTTIIVLLENASGYFEIYPSHIKTGSYLRQFAFLARPQTEWKDTCVV